MNLKEYRLVKKSLTAIFLMSFSLIMPVHAVDQIEVNDAQLLHGVEISEQLTVIKKSGEVSSCLAYFEGDKHASDCRIGEVPPPVATWLLIGALLGFVGSSNKRKI